jgi:hypothetical protein
MKIGHSCCAAEMKFAQKLLAFGFNTAFLPSMNKPAANLS